MFVDRLLCPVETLGPGRRLVVWTSGCSKRCLGCSNPELWAHRPEQEVEVEGFADCVVRTARAQGVDRLTMTGGDPLEQPDELLRFLGVVRPAFRDILVYTGYTCEEARERLGDVRMGRLCELMDALVDGRYVEELNDGSCALRGSANQRVLLFCEELAGEYEHCLAQGRAVQNFVYGGRVISVGIHGLHEKERIV